MVIPEIYMSMTGQQVLLFAVLSCLYRNNVVWKAIIMNEVFGRFTEEILAETLEAGKANPHSG